jgi:hypothetical protein
MDVGSRGENGKWVSGNFGTDPNPAEDAVFVNGKHLPVSVPLLAQSQRVPGADQPALPNSAVRKGCSHVGARVRGD